MADPAAPGTKPELQIAPPSNTYAVPGILASIVVALIIMALPTPEGLTVEGQRMAALFAVALILFVTEAIPIAVTSVLVLMLQPIMGITENIREAFGTWVTPVFFFVLVMFVVAQAVTVTGLARRFALWLLFAGGDRQHARYLGFHHRYRDHVPDHVRRAGLRHLHGDRSGPH